MSAAARGIRRLCLSGAVVGVFAGGASAATYRFDNFGQDGLWENGQNWITASTHGTVPGAADVAEVSNNWTAHISSAQTVSEVLVAAPNNAGSNVEGTATVRVKPGTDLRATSSNGIRIGRTLKPASLAGASKGIVIQTGGVVTTTSGTNGLRLSQADTGTTVADSLYQISDGSVRGGLVNGSMTAPLQIGLRTNTFLTAEINVIGSLVDDVRFEDIRFSGSQVNSGTAIAHMTLDSGGVTAMIAEDELRWDGTGTSTLVVDMAGYAPETNIDLIRADRLTLTNGATLKQFTGMPDGTPIVTNWLNYTYTWTLRYFDDAVDDGIRNSYVMLEFVSVTPEPGALSLAGIAALALLRRRRSLSA